MDTVYKVKAIQYIRKKAEPGRWMAVDAITLTYKFNPIELSREQLNLKIKHDVREFLGRNWAVVDMQILV